MRATRPASFCLLVFSWLVPFVLSGCQAPATPPKASAHHTPGRVLARLSEAGAADDVLARPQVGSVIAQVFDEVGYPEVERLFAHARSAAEVQAAHRQLREAYPERFHRSSLKPRLARGEALELPALERYFVLDFADTARVESIAARLAADPAVEEARADVVGRRDLEPNDPWYTSGGEDYLAAIGLPLAWESTTGDPAFRVALIDTGIHNNADLAANLYVNQIELNGNLGFDDDHNGYKDDIYGWFAYNNTPLYLPNYRDDLGHGTACAGVIGAVGNNGVGSAGVLWRVGLIPIMGETELSISRGIDFAVTAGAAVVSISQGDAAWGTSAVEAAIDWAHSQGVVVVSSAGNDLDEDIHHFPAPFPKMIAVSSYDMSALAQTDSYGPHVDVLAPWETTTTGWDAAGQSEYIADFKGTSAATPLVAGIVGLMLQTDPTLTVEEVRQVLRQTATDVGDAFWDLRSSFGLVNAGAAVSRLANGTIKRCEALIVSPDNYNVFRNGGQLVKGFAGGAAGSFDHYRVTVGNRQPYWTLTPYIAPDGTHGWLRNRSIFWQSGNLTTAVADGTLLALPAVIPDGPYTIHLEVFDPAGKLCGEDYKFVDYSSPTPVTFLDSANPTSHVGSTLAMGDVNGDGYDDLLIGDPPCPLSMLPCSAGPSNVYLALGAAHLIGTVSLANTAHVPASWTGNGRLGWAVAIMNLDGDAYGDVVLGMPTARDQAGSPTNTPGKVCIFLGSHFATWTRGMSPANADYCFYGQASGDHLGATLANAGDLDGDGLDDLAVSACGADNYQGRVYIAYSSSRASWSSSISINAAAGTTYTNNQGLLCDAAGYDLPPDLPLAGIGDFDGDGRPDLLVGDVSRAAIFRGRLGHLPNGELTLAEIALKYHSGPGFSSVAGVGDVNHDGRADIALGLHAAQGATPDGITLVYGLPGLRSYFIEDVPHDVIHDRDPGQSGFNAARLDDVTGDGIDDFVLGARDNLNVLSAEGGLAFVMTGGTAPGFSSGVNRDLQRSLLKASVATARTITKSQFGYGLASGRFYGGARRDSAVGQPGGTATLASRVYLFSP